MRKIFIASIFVFTICVFTFGQNSNCPTFSLTGPSAVPQKGETITFSVQVDEKAKNSNLEYVWSTSQGKIIEGQGTKVITVEWDLNPDMTATVEIKGLPEGCENSDSETVFVCSTPSSIMFDESEISSNQPGSEKLDTLISELKNNSDETAYFIIYPHKKDSPDEIKNKENYIRNYLLSNKIEADRLVFVTADNDEYESDDSVLRIWRVPAGATPPTP